MSRLTNRQIPRRHATPFAVSLASLTVLPLARPAVRLVPELSARGVPAGGIVEVPLLAAGESLADRQALSPLVAMWTADALLLAVVLLLVWRPSRPGPTRGTETLAIGG